MNIDNVIAEHYKKGTPVREIARIVNRHRANVINRAKRLGLEHPGRFTSRDIMGCTSSFTGEIAMNEPSRDDLARLRAICEERNLPFERWGIYWDKTKESSIAFFNKEAKEKADLAQTEFLDRVARTAPKTKKSPVPSKTLAIPTLFDVHIGKHCELIRTGNDYTPDKAVRQILQGLDGQHRDFKHFGVTDVLLPMGNDIVHVDNNGHTSTSGTPQDAYGSVESQMMLAVELYIRLIEDYSKHYNVWLAHVHSNHDRVSGWSVSQIVGAYFRNNKRVRWAKESLDQRHRKYFVFGDNLIMFHHGEGKEEKIVGLIDAEVRLASAQTKRTYVYQGHTHHKQVSKRGINTQNVEKDHSALTVMKPGNGAENRVFVETVRSPSPADDWHARSMYSNLPAIETFIHDAHSQRYRLTHWF